MRFELLYLCLLVGVCQAIDPFTTAIVGGVLASSVALYGTFK
jgi:hypothetical protein